MKLLIVSQYFWPENFRINEITKTLAEKDINIHVIAGMPNYPEGVIYPGYRKYWYKKEYVFGASIYRIPLIARGNKAWRLALNYISFVINASILSPLLLRKKNIDVIFVYAPSPILQAIPAIILGLIKKAPIGLKIGWSQI